MDSRRLIAAAMTVACLLPAAGWARPANPDQERRMVEAMRPPGEGRSAGAARLLSSYVLDDTVTYGGTVWAADSNRWEALRSSPGQPRAWTFETGVGSNFSEPVSAPKPAGWHHRMEGWTGVDRTFNPLPYYRRSATCVLNGGFSMWAGVSAAEAGALCFAAGQGYGNNWNLTLARSFSYSGHGTVGLSYVYRTECEPSYDYLNVNIDTTGTGAADDVNITSYTGALGPATGTHTLIPGVSMRSTAGPVTIKFNATSDGGYSDEDGGFPTSCGHSSVDDVRLTGAIVDFSDFEAGANGWANVLPTSGVGGDFSDIRALATLPPFPSFCACAVSDSVLVFGDTGGGHSTPVDNFAASPWIDLKAGGDVGKPGKVVLYHAATDLPLLNYIFTYTVASWYPAVCPTTGKLFTQPFKEHFGVVYFFQGPPACTQGNGRYAEDLSDLIPPSAEQVRIGIGVVSQCAMFANCTGVSNSTPWFDDISFGVYGATSAPIVTLQTMDVFQDSFSADGTLNPASTGRIDLNRLTGTATPSPGSVHGDTLLARGDDGNVEVRVVFHVRPGPFTSPGALAAWAAGKWSLEPALGAGWYSARMDTAEQGGAKGLSTWMGTLHESDPKFGGGTDTDRGGEGDFNQLSHDIFPDRLLTPGSRIDYFLKARYLPPDPRNPGGANWAVVPDTSGRNYLEVEILPSSMAADTTWNCVLYVNHHVGTAEGEASLERQGLSAALGVGGANAEGTRFDRYDVNAPSSNQGSLGRPTGSAYGATLRQLGAYRVVAWHAGTGSVGGLTNEDASLLSSWLQEYGNPGRRFWGSGDGLARGMTSTAGSAQVFLQAICGAQFTCDTIRLATCPTGSVLDTTFCLPLANVAGAAFGSTLPLNARGNGCPNLRSFDLLAPRSGATNARGQLAFAKSDGARNYAAVTNTNSVDVDYKTVIDGVAVGALRDPHGNVHSAALCDITLPAVTRAVDVLNWFRSPGYGSLCGPLPVSDADPGRLSPPATYRTALGNAYPNPMNPTTRIHFTVGRADAGLSLAIYDVTGRLVRTLVQGRLAEGPQDALWDGRDDRGNPVGSGLYFVRLAGAGVVESKKIVMAK